MITVTESSFGKLTCGQEATLFTISNSAGNKVSLTNFGARLVSWILPDKTEKSVDIILGYPNASGYETDENYMGATIGRNANRIANSQFVLEGISYELFANNGVNSLHGGKVGFDSKLWDAEIVANGVKFSYISPDGEENYPGELHVAVTFTLDEINNLGIYYEATTSATTICNLTNHAYFNLNGASSNSLAEETIQINADYFTWANPESIPDGRLIEVDGTPMDLRKRRPMLEDIDADYDQIQFASGYDHNWCINQSEKELNLAAVAYSPATGIEMSVTTDMPGIQFYAGNFLSSNSPGKDNVKYTTRAGFALETQYFPNAINIPSFAQPILQPGEIWRSTTIYKAYLNE